MKRKYMWMGIAGLILALGVSAVHARGHRGRQHHFAGPRFEKLDLTQEQKAQLKTLRSENAKKMVQIKADMEMAHIELRELMDQKDPNQRQVDKAVEKVNAAMSKMTERRVRQKLALNKILTEEQFQKLEEMPRGRRGQEPRGRRGHGPRMGRGMGGGAAPGALSQESGSQI